MKRTGEMVSRLLNRLSVRNRIWMIVAIVIGGVVLASALDILMLRGTLQHEKESATRQLVESGYGVLSHYHDLQQQGVLDEAAARAAALGTLRAMRYNGKDYFWVNDLGTPLPRMILHPVQPELEGKMLNAPRFYCATSLRVGTEGPFQATDGKLNLTLAFLEVVNRGGHGYVTYDWPKPLAGGGITTDVYPKLSYVKLFAPWGWVIGSGIYVDDVDRVLRERTVQHLELTAGVSLVLLLLASAIAGSITRPLRSTLALMDRIGGSEEGLGRRLPIEGCGEIAHMARGFNGMLERIQARDAALARYREDLENEVSRRTESLRDAKLCLENELAERKIAERALHDSNERFRGISDTAQDAILMLSDDGRISYWNKAAERIFGYGQDEALGQDLHELLAPERFREAFQRGFEHFRTSGEGGAVGKTLELAAMRKGGGEFPMELSISPVRLGERWFAVGFVRDISERKRAEQDLGESQARMRALLDADGETMLLLDIRGGILAINVCGAERFNLQPEDMLGRNFFDFLPPELAESRRLTVQHVISTGEPLESQDCRGNIRFSNSVYPVKDMAGTVTSIAVQARDVTEQWRIEQVEDLFRRLDEMLLKWRMNMESIGQMFCDDILPVFDLAAAWIGRAEKDGRIKLLGCTESMGPGFLAKLSDDSLRWDADDAGWPMIETAIRKRRAVSGSLADIPCLSGDLISQSEGARCVLVLPLALRGKTWGVLTLYGREPRMFEGGQLTLQLTTLARRLGMTIDAALQQEWLSLLDSALAGVGNAVLITDGEARILWANSAFTKLSGYANDDILGKTPSLFSSGVQGDEFFRTFWQTIRDGESWHGDIVNARPDGSRYTAHQTVTPLVASHGGVSHFVSVMEDVSEQKALEARIQHAANYDQLTNLPNRSLFFDRLGQAMALARRDGQRGALLFLDLDHFKDVNDQLGHAAGDRLLVVVAERLQEQVRESDTVARLAGDEFTIILTHLNHPEDATRVAEKILAAIEVPVDMDGGSARVGISIGVAIFPDHGDSVEAILQTADSSMYQAKREGRSRIFQGEIDAA